MGIRKKKIAVLTGGGDVQPLNALLAAASDYAASHNVELLGFLKGWEGALEKRYLALKNIALDPLVGGTVLKSSRVNLAKVSGGVDTVERNFRSLGLDGLVVVGGEDTLSNSLALRGFPQVLVSKTIDNDVGKLPDGKGKIDLTKMVNYFTLGYPTAAMRISRFVSLRHGLRTTAYSHQRIMVVESMGMHAGWLALASSVGHPDFIVIPEFPLDYDAFKEKVAETYVRQKHMIIVIAEGARWQNGTYVAADEKEIDSFGHPRFKGSAAVLAEKLKTDLKTRFDTRNINSVNPSYLYRSGSPERIDFKFAQRLGATAVRLLAKGLDEPVFLTVKKEKKSFGLKPVSIQSFGNIEQLHRFVDTRYYSERAYTATKEAWQYLRHIVEEIPSVRYGISVDRSYEEQ